MLAYRVKGIRWRRVVGRKVKAKGWCAVFPRVNQKNSREIIQLMQDFEFIRKVSTMATVS